MIPFISLGNAVLVILYGLLCQRSRWLALGIAAMAKFIFLYGTVTLLVARPLRLETAGSPQAVTIPESLLAMMSWPQLITAITGGLLAFGIHGITKARF